MLKDTYVNELSIKELDCYLIDHYGYSIYNFVRCFAFISLGWVWRHLEFFDVGKKRRIRLRHEDYDKEINTYKRVKKSLIKTLKPFYKTEIIETFSDILFYDYEKKGKIYTDEEKETLLNRLKEVTDEKVVNSYKLKSFFKELDNRLKTIETWKVDSLEDEAELDGAPVKSLNKIASVYATIIKEKNSPYIEDIACVIEWINYKLKSSPAYVQFPSKIDILDDIDSLRREIARIKSKNRNISHINRVKKLVFPKSKKINPLSPALYFEEDSSYFLPLFPKKGRNLMEDPYSVELISFPDNTAYSLGDYLENFMPKNNESIFEYINMRRRKKI